MSRRSVLASVVALALLGALALLVLSACAGPSNVVVVTCKGKQFNPPVVTIHAGQTIKWINDDETAHTTTSMQFVGETEVKNQPSGWNSNPLNPGDSFERTFNKAGSFPYQCMVHPYMEGTITVLPK